jgi:hypothetical protein
MEIPGFWGWSASKDVGYDRFEIRDVSGRPSARFVQVKYIPDKHEHIVHVYRRDEPHATERALCGWRPPNTWHPKNGPVPLTVLPDCERCPRCLDRIARKPDQLYALMPPEDWIKWEGAAMSEQDPSGDPGATGPRESKAGAAAAKAYAKAQRPWNKKAWWVFSSGLILLVIVVAAVAPGGSDNSSSTASDSGAANSAASGNEATPKESKPESTPASSGPTDELPLRDGDWRLDSISVDDNGYGDFSGIARITYTGEKPEGEDNIFTVTLFKGGKDVAVLQGAANAVTREDTATVQLPSSDPWVGGPYTYDFRAEL